MLLRKIAVVSLVVFGTLCATGCAKEDVTQDIITHMEIKYNDSFEYKEPFGGGAHKEDLQMLLSSKEYPDEDVWVSYYEVDGQPVIEDNYLCVKFKQNTIDALTAAANNVIDDDFVLHYEVRPLVYTEGSSGAMSFEEFIQEPTSHITFRVAVNSGNIDENYKKNIETKLEEKLKEYGICARIGVFFFYESDAYNEIVDEFMGQGEEGANYISSFKFTMDDVSSGYKTTKWE